MKPLLLVLCILAWPVQACQTALMFAIDTSGSINDDEWALQTEGLADALLDPEIAQLIIGGQVALSAFQWAGQREQDYSLPWREIKNQTHLIDFANGVRNLPRRWKNGKTAIGTAMQEMALLFDPVKHCGRHIIDLSGDGVLNNGSPLKPAREQLAKRHITLNGLAIEPRDRFEVDGFKSLDIYYRGSVIVGKGAFVQAADGYRDYPRAIRLKLLTELGLPVS